MKKKLKFPVVARSINGLVGFTNALLIKMTGNANFPSPEPTLEAIADAKDALVAAAAAATFRDQRAIVERNDAEQALRNLLSDLALYISFVAKGSGPIITSAGFPTQRTAAPLPPLLAPLDFIVSRGTHSNSLALDWKAVAGGQTYVVEMTQSDPATNPNSWVQAGLTTKSRFALTNLDNAAYYWFRVKAIGRRDDSPYSDVALIQVAS